MVWVGNGDDDMAKYTVFTNTAGEYPAATLAEARFLAQNLDAPEWDRPRIFEWLPMCTDCTCGGQIHPKSTEVA